MFTQDTNFFPEGATTSDLAPLVPRKSNARNTRSLTPTVRLATTSGMAAQMTYAVNTLLKGSAIEHFEINRRICFQHSMFIKALKAEAEATGDPTALVQAFYGNATRGRYEGDLISVMQCEEVEYYQLLGSVDIEPCMKEFPVEFEDMQGKIRKGYITNSHEIRFDFTPIECEDVRPYFFTYRGKSYALRGVKDDIIAPPLPNPGFDVKYQELPVIAMKPRGGFTRKEFTDAKANDAYHMDMAKYKMKEYSRTMEKLNDGEDGGVAWVQNLKSSLEGAFLAYFEIVTTVIAILGALVVIFILMKLNFFSCIFNAFKKVAYKSSDSSGENVGKTSKNQTGNENSNNISLNFYGASAPAYSSMNSADEEDQNAPFVSKSKIDLLKFILLC